MSGREQEFFKPQQITSIELPHRAKSQNTRELLAADNYCAEEIIEENIVLLRHLSETPFGAIGQKMLKDPSLDFKDSFLGMTFVVAATNRGIFEQLKKSFEIAHGIKNLKQEQLQAPAQTFLTGMAQKEAYAELDHEEIAGMATAGMMDINLRLRFSPYVLETSGMGGDKGFMKDGKKTKVINASTLSAITLAGMGLSVLKHGSYANTSAVGSTEAAEALGISIHQRSHAEIKALFDATGFYFSDAHASKTIHDLSHSPFVKYETINHLVGPMTPPVDRQTTLHKLLGVNEGVNPETVAKAYEFMNTHGYQRVGHAIILTGLDDRVPPDALDHFDRKKIKPHMILDEVSPYQTLIAIVQNGKYIGQEVLKPEDFGVNLNPDLIQQINNQEGLLAANLRAISGSENTAVDYLAMNASLGLFLAEYMDRDDAITHEGINKQLLKEAFMRCREALAGGQASRHLQKIIEVSNTHNGGQEKKTSILDNTRAVIFDIDDTLISPKVPRDFYSMFSQAVNRAVATRLGVDYEEGARVADFFREHESFNGGEHALFSGQIGNYFPQYEGHTTPDFAILYDEMVKIDPSGHYNSHEDVVNKLLLLKERGLKIVGLTDSPEGLSRKLLMAAGINPEEVFDVFVGGSRDEGPHKLLRREQKFAEIAHLLGVPPDQILAVGDSFSKDIAPALSLGMKGCYLGTTEIPGCEGETASTIHEVFEKMGI